MGRMIAAAFLLLPVIEIALVVAVSQLVGVGPTVLALLALSLIGVLILRSAGRRGWQAMRQVAQGSVVSPRGDGGVLTVLGGVLLAVPGFLTAAAGLLLFLPPVRELVRRRTRRWAGRRGAWVVVDRFGRPATRPRSGSGGAGGASGNVVRGEVVEDRDQ